MDCISLYEKSLIKRGHYVPFIGTLEQLLTILLDENFFNHITFSKLNRKTMYKSKPKSELSELCASKVLTEYCLSFDTNPSSQMTKPNLKIKTKDSPINKAFINDTSSINQIHLHEIRPSYGSKEQRLNNVECPLKRKKLFENRFDMSLQTGNDKNLTCQMGSKTNACFLSGHSRQHQFYS